MEGFEPLPAPSDILAKVPLPEAIADQIAEQREQVRRALAGDDHRFLVIVGPCSIHEHDAAIDYARRLAELQAEVSNELLIIMRVYFEKPRTTIGWKGLINDPHLNGSNDLVFGLTLARKILLEIAQLGLPCGTEFLDPIIPQYTSDLVSWAAIGARTTESQTHRQMASGLSMPVGFKNATDGGMQIAIDAMHAARHPHAFLGVDVAGQISLVKTKGNRDVHMVLRGGMRGTNYSRADIAYAKILLEEASLAQRSVLVDCSHGNSNKDHRQQPVVFDSVLRQYLAGERAVLGAMLESNLEEGKQNISDRPLTYGKSVTDACVDWPTTEKLLRNASKQIASKQINKGS